MSAVMGMIKAAEPTPELKQVLDNLAARRLQDFVRIDHAVVRGLAYYTGIVFEAFDRKGEFRAIAGGGRYDNLVKLLSGGKVDLPALGFGMGDVVLLELLKSRGMLPSLSANLDVFCLIENETLRAQSLKLIQEMRQDNLAVDYPLIPSKSDKQFKRAQELKAAFTAKLEAAPDGDPVVKVKNLVSREEKALSLEEAVKNVVAARRSGNLHP